MVNRLLVFFLLSTLFLVACTERPPTQLPRKNRIAIDTLFSRQVSALKQETDSICEEMMANELQMMVDSLLIERRKEIARLRDRVRGND